MSRYGQLESKPKVIVYHIVPTNEYIEYEIPKENFYGWSKRKAFDIIAQKLNKSGSELLVDGETYPEEYYRWCPAEFKDNEIFRVTFC